MAAPGLAVTTPAAEPQVSATAPDSSPHAAARRKFKAAELPLTTAVRSAIEGLAHAFKKKGGYDAIRKQAWEKFEASVRAPIRLSLFSILGICHLTTLRPSSI